MSRVFADSHFFFALLNDRDQSHAKAVAFNQSFAGRIVTTPWVITELADGLASPGNRSAFLRTVDLLRNDPDVAIIACSDELFWAGIDRFRNRSDKEWSLTDCISFVVMERQGITDALTVIVISNRQGSWPY